MASTYTANSGIEKPGSGEQSGTWGDTTNTNFDIIDRALNGVGAITLSGTTHTLTTTDGALSDGGYKVLVFGGSPSGTNTVTISPNDQDKVYLVKNGTNQSVIITQGSGGNATISSGSIAWVFADGAGATAAVTAASFDVVNDTSPQLGGNLDVNAKNIVFGDSSGASDDRLTFGAGTDLSIYHDGSESRIVDSGTGQLILQTNKFRLFNAAGDENLIQATEDGQVVLYHNNNAKIETTSAGVDVTGTVQGDSFTLDNSSNDWTFTVSSNNLIISYAGTAKAKLDTSGNLTVVGNVTAYGSI